jgi:hypothetical protein
MVDNCYIMFYNSPTFTQKENTVPEFDPNLDLENEDDGLFAEEAAPAGLENFAEVATTQAITVRTTSGAERYVNVAAALPLSEVLASARIPTDVNSQYWLNGAQVNLGDSIAPGQSVVMIGSVKGG